MLTEAEVEEIKKGVRAGLRGPIMLKWIEQLLTDRDERVRLERERQAHRDGQAAVNPGHAGGF